MKTAKGTHGGARPGAGKPKGHLAPQTLDKIAARELVRVEVMKRIGPLIEAQLDNAVGIKHFMKRDGKTGKFERLTDPDQITAALNADDAEEGTTYWIYEKDPSPQSAKELLDRALDRAKEQEQEFKISGDSALMEALQAGRKRASTR